MKRIFFSVGEPSGDLHGSNLIRRLHQIDPTIECVGFGGPKMVSAGFDQHYDLTQHAVMMLAAIIRQLRFFFGLVDQAEEFFKANQVDAVVLIDYPGFNWHVAKRAKKLGIPVFYFGVPQIWAWAPWRIRKVRKYVDHVLCKLPFEKAWFEKRGCKATYIGHPFFDQLTQQEYDQEFMDTVDGEEPILLLLPGSRNREVRDNFPIMMRAAETCQQKNEKLKVRVGCFNQKHADSMKEMLAESKLDIEIDVQRTPELMRVADVCLACSGSVSLELMYHKLPTVIVYRISRWKGFVQRILIRARYITLVNLLRAKKINRDGIRHFDPDAPGAESVPMPEYLIWSDESERIAKRLEAWLENDVAREEAKNELGELAAEFGVPGASEKAAQYIAETLSIQKARAAAA